MGQLLASQQSGTFPRSPSESAVHSKTDADDRTAQKKIASAFLNSKTSIESLRRNNLLYCRRSVHDGVNSRPFPDLATLPSAISLTILSHLNETDLCLAACVNEQWRQLADDDLLWLSLVRVSFVFQFIGGLDNMVFVSDSANLRGAT